MKNLDTYGGKRAYHSDIASNYDRDRSIEPVWTAEQLWVESWIGTLPTGATVLDLPAGTGRFTPLLLARGLGIQAMDISAEMLSQIQERHADQIGKQLTVRTGDAENLDVPANSVDYVLSWRFFHLLPASMLPRVLGEFARVARREVIVNVFSVNTGGRMSATWHSIKDIVRPFVRTLRRRESAFPWGHIESFSHHEATLRRAWKSAGLKLKSAETIADYSGLPVRVYRLLPARE